MFRRWGSGEESTGFLAEVNAEDRREAGRQLLRWGAIFLMLYAGVFFAFWWPGAAVRFGAARVADRAAPTWRVEGVVRDARTGAGLPRYGRTAAARPEAHRLRVTAAGYRAGTVNVGRQWFVWMPTGVGRIHIVLVPTQY